MAIGQEIWRYRGLISNLAQRELKLRYKRSILGWVWSLVNPAAMMVVYTVVFGVFLRIPPPVGGNGELKSFALFLFCGLLVWNLFNSIVPGCMTWLLTSGPLLNKVYFPPEAPLFAGALSVLVQTGTEAVILIAAFMIAGNLSWTFLLLLPILACVALFAIGIGLAVSVLNVYFRDMTHVIPIALTLLFFATPIVYPYDFVPATMWGGVPVGQLIRLNPLTQFVGSVRDILYDLRVPNLLRLAALLFIALVTFAGGWAIFRTQAHRISEEL